MRSGEAKQAEDLVRIARDTRIDDEGARALSDYPLTRRQTLFWLDEQLYPGVPYHHVVLRVTFSGALDLTSLRAAYQETLLSFDHFRLVFCTRDGAPRQRFASDLDLALPLIDLSASPELLDTWIARRSCARFDFARALFEGALLRLSPNVHVLYFCQHHIIADGTSAGLFLADLALRYRGESVPARPSFAQYLRQEQAYQASARATRDASYFDERLELSQRRAVAMPPLSLYGRTRVRRSLGIVRTRIDAGAQRSRALAELERDPRFQLLDGAMSRMASLATLLFAFLYRASGSRTLLIAMPLPNRGAEFVHTGGLIMEQAFLRVELEDGETFVTLAAKVRAELVGALRHGKHCIGDHGLSYASLNLLRLPSPRLEGLDIEVTLAPAATWLGERAEPHDPQQGDLRDTFGLHVFGFAEDQPLRIGFDFHADTFDRATRERAHGHFLALLDAMLADPQSALEAIDLLAPDERAALLRLGRGRQRADSAPDPLLRFREISTQRAGQPAVRFAGRSVSYQELFEQAGRLATRLVALGARPGERVAFCLPRGPDELVAMLASWIAGAAYVPIDGSHPQERVQMILADARPAVLITQRALFARLGDAGSARLLLLDEERAAWMTEPVLPLPDRDASLDLEQPAYVLFTSGSTGRPKGVVVPRRAIANFLSSMAEVPGLTPEDRLLAITTTSFDIAALELLLPLWTGACAVIADRETALDMQKLLATLEREAITVLQATPTTWRLLLEAGLATRERPLKMLCGGEAISRELAQRLLAAGGELWNMYGPTETTVWSTLQRLMPGDETVRIGRPIDGTQCYVLGAGGVLEPRGVTGELYIGGVGVALGYLGRDELTRERFVANPHGSPGERIYRTGDLARWLPDGTLECLGRLDHQVKLRGFRIELAEIESCLRALPMLDEVVVAALGPSEELRLVAYWVGAEDAEPALRARAAESLPSYMQPAAYVRLPALPLNSNGKIDRKQLPAPSTWSGMPAGKGPEITDERERRMARLFQEVLAEAGEIPADKDFFMLGGDSLRAMKLRQRIHEEFGSELSLAALFEAPTVRGLTAALDA